MSKKTGIGAALLLAAAVLQSAATEYIWTGTADNNWSNTANWVNGTLPPVSPAGEIFGTDNTIILQANAPNSPQQNVPPYGGYTGDLRMPTFILGENTSLEITAGPSVLDNGGIDRIGKIAEIGPGAVLTIVRDSNMTLARDPDGEDLFCITNGTLNIQSGRLDFGFTPGRYTRFIVNGGRIHLYPASGEWYNLALYGTRLVADTPPDAHSTVILTNGAVFDINGRFENNMKDADGDPYVVFDLQDRQSVVTFRLSAYYPDLSSVISNALGSVFISSTLGNGEVWVTESNGWAVVQAVGRPPEVTWEPIHPISGDSDVISSQQVVMAVNLGKDITQPVTINDVTFEPYTTAGVSYSVTGYTYSDFVGGAPTIPAVSEEYLQILRPACWNVSSLVVSNLTPGRTYTIELWSNDSRGNTNRYTDVFATDGSIALHIPQSTDPTGTAGYLGYYAVGTFTASSAPLVLSFQGGDGGAVINAFAIFEANNDPYDDWVKQYGLSGESADPNADPDGDGLDNLAEYALGGNPSDAADIGHAVFYRKEDENGTNYLLYVHAERNDADARSLSYAIEQIPNLVSGTWTTQGVERVGRGPLDAEFDVVTNRVPTIETSTFLRLHIQKN